MYLWTPTPSMIIIVGKTPPTTRNVSNWMNKFHFDDDTSSRPRTWSHVYCGFRRKLIIRYNSRGTLSLVKTDDRDLGSCYGKWTIFKPYRNNLLTFFNSLDLFMKECKLYLTQKKVNSIIIPFLLNSHKRNNFIHKRNNFIHYNRTVKTKSNVR